MIFPSVDNFLRIFNFYQLNSIRYCKQLSQKISLRFDSIDKYFEALNYDYPDGQKGLNFPQHKDEILQAINSRLDISKYFNGAGFPGSYSFNTQDCFMFKSIMLDWAGTIKTFQDTTAQCTNAYSLSSDEVDKAIRGFGIDFINGRTVASLNRRQTFLLNMCDLYKIKGSPQSIVKALNIIGLDDCYITEAWVYPTRDGKENVEIKWIPVKQPSELIETSTSGYYTDPNEGIEEEYWEWGKFNSKLDEIKECHWFYKKWEIVRLNWNQGIDRKDKNYTYFHLPSLTPYFNVKIKFSNTDHATTLRLINRLAKEQLQDYLNGVKLPKDIVLGNSNLNIDFISAWQGFLYILVMYADYLRFNDLRKFVKRFGFTGLDTNNIVGINKFLELIYRVYTFINKIQDFEKKQVYQKTLEHYVLTACPIGYCSYDEVEYWWINRKHEEIDDINGLDSIKSITEISNYNILGNGKYLEIFWNEKYNYGYYDIQICLDEDGSYYNWITIEENTPVACQSMQRIIELKYDDVKIPTIDIRKRIRIVHHHTAANIPSIFFQKPFYFGQGRKNTDLDMIYYYSDFMMHDVYYKNNPIYNIFKSKTYGVQDSISEKDLIDEYNEYLKNIPFRNVDRDYRYATYMNSFLNYPTSLFVEDKDILKETALKKYITDVTFNYKDFITHEGENLKYINTEKRYPQNKKWNWAISYGKNYNETYFFLNYEGTKWLRINGPELFIDSNISFQTDFLESDYGIPLYKNNNVYIHVSKNNSELQLGSYFQINQDSPVFESEWNALGYERKEVENTVNNFNLLKNEYNVKDLRIEDNKLVFTAPPSDIFPSSVIHTHKFIVKEKNDEGFPIFVEKNFYYSDGIFKPDSKLAKCVVIDRVDLSYIDSIFQNISEVQNSSNIDSDPDNNMDNIRIPVYNDPFGSNIEYSYQISDLLKYMYKNGYILDINTGYIYRSFNYYLDEQTNYLYIKCINLDDDSNALDKIKYKWIRTKVSRCWDFKEKRRSIYYELDENFEYVKDRNGKKRPLFDCGYCDHDFTYRRVYDAERYLADPLVTANDYSTVTDSDVHVLHTGAGRWCCEAQQNYINKNDEIDKKYVAESNIKTYSYDKNSDETYEVYTQFTEPLIYNVNYGISQDLLDYINGKITSYEESMEQYINVLLELAEAIQNYFKNNGYRCTLDVYNTHIFSSRLVRNIINFYKPKRDRMLKLTSQLEIDFNDNIIADIDDINYNKVFLNDTDPVARENGLMNRSRIKQQINEYVPFNDLIFLKDYKNNNEVVNYREIYPYVNSTIPKMETYDQIDNIGNYSMVYNNQKIYAVYYCSDFDDNVNGFYFDISGTGKRFTNNRFYFYKGSYTFISDYDVDGNKMEKPTYITLTRWFIYEYQYRNDKCYKFSYVSEKDISDNPYLKSNGEPIKYCRLVNVNSYNDLILFINNTTYEYGSFQYYTPENSGFVKTNKKDIEPVFYIGSFENPKYNGYYYNVGNSRFDHPIYINVNGKMISYYDLTYLPDEYLDLTIKEYHKHGGKEYNRFWIITDYHQIPDISEATYVAFCESSSDTSIFKTENGISTGETKTFYKLNPRISEDLSDLLFVCGVTGYSIDTIEDNPQLLGRDFQTYQRRMDNNGSYTIPVDKYANLIDRRISQNTLPELYTPISYINFYYGNELMDYYKDCDGNYITRITFLDRDKGIIKLTKDRYGHDFYGYQQGAIYCSNFTEIHFQNNITEKDLYVIIRLRNVLEDSTKIKPTREDSLNKYIREHDSKWHIYLLKYIKKENKTYLYKNGQFVRVTDIDIHDIVIKDQICYICEYSVFDQEIPTWYLDIIYDYGVFAYRKEQAKRNNCFKNSYEPLFNTEIPINRYGKMMTGLPENVEGDRFSSTLYSNGKFLTSSYDGRDRYNTYKWDAASYYKVYLELPDHTYICPNSPQEMNILWSRKTCNRIYDRNISPKYNIDGDIVGVNIERKYVDNRLTQNGLENIFCEKQKVYFSHGQELKVPGNYISPFDVFEKDGKKLPLNLPIWWTRKPEDYKTGPVQHRPVIIGIRQKFDDHYPVVRNGSKLGKYLDEGLKLDGDAYKDCHGNYIFNTSEIDSNTGYISTINKFLSDPGIERGKFHERKLLENIGDSFDYPCENIESNIFYDPSLQEVTQDMKDNHIYHKTLRLNYCFDFSYDISGVYHAAKMNPKYKDEYDFDYCYVQTRFNSNYYKLEHKIKNNYMQWDNSDSKIDLFNDLVAVLTYDNMCRHYIWEIRRYENYLSLEKEIDCKFCFETNIKSKDGDYYYSICKESVICTNYVKCRFILNDPDNRFLDDDTSGYFPEDYDEVVDIAIQYGSVEANVTINPDLSLDELKEYYERFTKTSIHNINELYMAAFLLNSKYRIFCNQKRSNKMYYAKNNYDYINQLQLDLCGQKLCQYDPQLREKYRTMPYVDVKQNVINDSIGFICYSILKFNKKTDSEFGKKEIKNRFIYNDFYTDEDNLYIRNGKFWYGPFKYNETDQIPKQLDKICCKLNCIFTGQKLYVKTQDRWVSVQFTYGTYDKLCIPFETYLDSENNILLCMCETNPEMEDWNYYPDTQKLQTTVSRYMTLNNRGHEQFDHFGERWPEDLKDDVYFGKGNKQTILDKLFVYVYYICTVDKKSIILHKPESEESVEDPVLI